MKSDCHAQYNSTTTIIANVYFKWSVEIYISTSQLNTMERVVEFGTEQKFDYIYATTQNTMENSQSLPGILAIVKIIE